MQVLVMRSYLFSFMCILLKKCLSNNYNTIGQQSRNKINIYIEMKRLFYVLIYLKYIYLFVYILVIL